MNDPGTAAPQCGLCANRSEEESRSGERRTQQRSLTLAALMLWS